MCEDTGILPQGPLPAVVPPTRPDPVLEHIERVRDADADQGGEDAEVRVVGDPVLLQREIALAHLVVHVDAAVRAVVLADDLGARHRALDLIPLHVLDGHRVRIIRVVGGGGGAFGGNVAEGR